MKFVAFLLFGLGVFSLALAGRKKHHSTTLYALAIGGVVNANYFYAAKFPIDCFGLPFGIDSLIYGLFSFCVMVMLLQDSKRSAYLLAVSSLIAIAFSASMELIAGLFVAGSSLSLWLSFANFMLSILASAIGVIAAVEIVNRLKAKWNSYVCLALGMGIICFINNGIHQPLSAILVPPPQNLWLYIATSAIGRTLAILYGLLIFKILRALKKRNK